MSKKEQISTLFALIGVIVIAIGVSIWSLAFGIIVFGLGIILGAICIGDSRGPWEKWN